MPRLTLLDPLTLTLPPSLCRCLTLLRLRWMLCRGASRRRRHAARCGAGMHALASRCRCPPACILSRATTPHPPIHPSPPRHPHTPQLVEVAWAKWLAEEEGVVDDITVVAVKLNPM